MSRGIHLSPKEAVILRLLRDNIEMYGLQMVKASDNQLKRGTVYVTLMRMKEKGYVSSREESSNHDQSGLPRPLYRIEGLGERVLSAWDLIQTNNIGAYA